MSNIIKLKNVSKSYGDKVIFNDFNMNIEKGDYIAVTGKSGAGKSTLLNMIGLIETPDSGNISVCGIDNPVLGSKATVELLRYKIGYLFQNFGLIENESVEKNIKISSRFKKWSSLEENERIKEVLEYVGMTGTENKKIYQLSGGEQQRIAIAKLVLKSPEIILADEPTGSLDPENKEVVMRLIGKMHDEGKTIVIVTHDEKVTQCAEKTLEL